MIDRSEWCEEVNKVISATISGDAHFDAHTLPLLTRSFSFRCTHALQHMPLGDHGGLMRTQLKGWMSPEQVSAFSSHSVAVAAFTDSNVPFPSHSGTACDIGNTIIIVIVIRETIHANLLRSRDRLQLI